MEQIGGKADTPTLKVDAGNLLFEHVPVAEQQRRQARITALGIMEAYRLLEVDAVGIGRNDLGLGLDLLQGDGLPFVNADIVDKAGLPVFKETRIRELGSLKAGITGLAGASAQSLLPEGFAVLDWRKALPAVLDRLRGQCDVIVLLSALTTQENLEIARSHPDVSLIFEAEGGAGNKPPVAVGRTLITHVTNQGKYLGVLDIDWHGASGWAGADLAEQIRGKQSTIDRLSWQIRRIEQRGAPTEVFKSDPAGLSAYNRLIEQRRQEETLLAGLRRNAALADPANPPSTFAASFIGLESSMPDRADVLLITERIKTEIAAANQQIAAKGGALPATPLATPRDAGYAGYNSCTACHRDIAGRWQQTRHARAFDSLETKGQQFNGECIVCHVTGVITGNEPYLLTLPENLLQVGCEACHGPGLAHAAAPESVHPQKKPAAAVCLRCHTPEQDDHFDYDRKSKLVH